MTTSEGEGTQSGAEGAQSGAGENANGDNVDKGKETSSTAGGQSDATDETVSKSELIKQQERTRAADERAAKVEKELKQLRDKDLPEQEKLARDYEEATKQVDALRATNGELSLKVAFLEDNAYKWKNPKAAMKLVDLSQVKIEEDGSVSGLKDALKALATSDPYLLEPKTEKEPDKPGSTAPGNNGATGGTKPNVKTMAARIPAMGTRMKRNT
jgi:hypothetical protein